MRWYENTSGTHCLPGRVSRLWWMLCGVVGVAGSRVCVEVRDVACPVPEQGRNGETAYTVGMSVECWVVRSMPVLQCRDGRRS